MSDIEAAAPAAVERNRQRRAGAGIEKLTDVEIPLRDGVRLLADVYRPEAPGRYPVIVRLGIYGRAFGTGSVCDDASGQASEEREALWFEKGPAADAAPMRRFAESAVSANAFDWVPRGYVCVRVDGRGVGRVPGVIDPFSRTEALDYYDVIQWAAGQPWSDGAVGLYGGSYHATLQWNVASLQPPALRAMIPWSGDSDPYRDLAYPGGILIRGYREMWVRDLVKAGQCDPDPPMVDVVGRLESHPFDEPEHYGPEGEVFCGPDFDRVTVPFLTSVNIASTIHGRGGAEAFGSAASADTQLVVVDANYWEFMYRDCLAQQFAFFDRHLKGDGRAPAYPRVRMIMRTGHGGFEWREDTAWPPPTTTYRALYLDAGPRALDTEAPVGESTAGYPAEVDPDPAVAGPGATFESSPLGADLELAGHVSATLWVSATAADMDLYATVRVIDPSGTEVPYAVRPREAGVPLAFGCLKVSQRALDQNRTNGHRPWHTHRAADASPLRSPDEVVPVQIDLGIATARIPAGHRIRLVIQPFEGRGRPAGAGDRPTRHGGGPRLRGLVPHRGRKPDPHRARPSESSPSAGGTPGARRPGPLRAGVHSGVGRIAPHPNKAGGRRGRVADVRTDWHRAGLMGPLEECAPMTGEVEGLVEAGFEGVAKAFQANFAQHGEIGAAFCLHVGGRKVVDVWGGTADRDHGVPYGEDTLQLVFSSTKGPAAACANLLAQRGLLDVDAPVVTYWPEFAQAGKERIPVRWLLCHKAGLPTVDARLTRDEALAWEPVIHALEIQQPFWEPGSASGYHALTYGHLVGEVIRRIDGRTPGQFFADEIARPLGLEFWIGLPAEHEGRVAPIIASDPPRDPETRALLAKYMGPDSLIGRALSLNGALALPADFNTPEVHAAELPAANGVTTARSLSRLYAGLIGTVAGGPPGPLLTTSQIQAARTTQTSGPDRVLSFFPGVDVEMTFGLGFMTSSPYCPLGGAGSFGHAGAGGSLGFADPENGLAFGYVMNRMMQAPTGDPRTKGLIQACYDAVDAPVAYL